MKHTNGTLEELNARELMEKVYERQTGLNTVREFNGKEYTIFIHGHKFIMALDGTETWDIDIIVEDENGEQRRLTTRDMRDLSKEECIAKLEATVKEIIGEEQEEEEMTLAMNEYMNYFKNMVIRYDSERDAIEKMAKEMKASGIDYDTIYSIKEKMMKSIELDKSYGECKAYRAWQNTVRKDHGATILEMSDFLWENEVAGFVLALRTAGLKKFYYTNSSTAVMDNLHGFTAAGCKVGKMITVKEEDVFGDKSETLGIEIIL